MNSDSNQAEQFNKAAEDIKQTKKIVTPPDGAFKTEPSGKGGWRPKPELAGKFAESLDKKINGFKNGMMQARLFLDLGAVGRGKSETLNVIRDSGLYKLDYPVMGDPKKAPIRSAQTIVKKGAATTVFDGKTLTTRMKPAPMTLDEFGRNFPSYLVSGFLSSEKPFTKLVALARAQKWTIKSDTTFQNTLSSSRLVLTSPKMDRVYEIITTDNLGFPTTIRTTMKNGKSESKLAWFGYWGLKGSEVTESELSMSPDETTIAKQPLPGASK